MKDKTFKVSCQIKSSQLSDLIKLIGINLLGYTEANIIVQYNDKLLNRLSTKDFAVQSLLEKTLTPHTYNLFLRTNSKDKLESIICREMAHFDQYEKEILKTKEDEGKTIYLYKDQECSLLDNSIWEKETRTTQYELIKQLKKLKNKQ